MSYLIAIKTAIFIFPILALLFTIPFILHQYHKYGSINKFRVFIIYSFILYMMTIYFLVILPLPNKEEVLNNTNMVRLESFAFVNDFIRESSFVFNNPATYLKSLTEPCFYIVAFNILMTIPFGMYLRYYFKYNCKKVVIYGFLLSLFFELTQITGLYFIYPKPYRLFDVDDLILNTTGALIGYFIMGLIDNFLPTREQIDDTSYKKGAIVSGLRRTTIFLLDLFLFGSLLSLTFLLNISCLKYILFIVYYLLIPCLTKGYTLGSMFLNVKIEYQNHFILRTIVRNSFVFSYFTLLPYSIFLTAIYLTSHHFIMFIYVFLIFMIVLFYPVHFIFLIKNKNLFYDRVFKSVYTSTIIKNE